MELTHIKEKLVHRYEGSRRVAIDPARLSRAVNSPIFLRLVCGILANREDLWDHLKFDTTLTGDPTSWVLQSDLTTRTWKIVDHKSHIHNMPGFRNVIVKHLADNKWHLLTRAVFINLNFGVSIEQLAEPGSSTDVVCYLVRKSQAYNYSPDTCVEWIIDYVESGATDVTLKVSVDSPVNPDISRLLGLLESVASTDDVAVFREERRKEQQRLAEQERLEREKWAQDQKKFEDRVRILNDQCLKCGEPCVQRRRKSDGKLFFGCSQFTTTKCRGTRDITCPQCDRIMREVKKKDGGSFLGCPAWPNCRGSRSIDPTLGTLWDEPDDDEFYGETLDDLAREWGWDNWNHFDDHRD